MTKDGFQSSARHSFCPSAAATAAAIDSSSAATAAAAANSSNPSSSSLEKSALFASAVLPGHSASPAVLTPALHAPAAATVVQQRTLDW